MKLTYLVIKCNDIEKSKSFYEAIGFLPVKEKHGKGAEHYSFALNDFIIELYPSSKIVEGNLIMGLEIKIPIVEIKKRLKFISYETEPSKNKDGNFSINDPDGNKIRIDS
ncbi:MAG: VOC family protein [Leptospiraceae bacterium]|nr:VOC family protein [Leptospiraceae bacterium]MBK9499249.1 VOC family protein [Leptospiraceae bacterium]MBK9502937.1 VOC family protein [Leptospiraceae bacterium]MBP9164366.1 VOC family protein [Leptospiraceae bacterium]